MRTRRAVVLFWCVLLGLVSCASDPDPFAESTTTDRAEASGSGDEPTDPPAEVTRPQPGQYVYEIIGVGATNVPAGTAITEHVTVSGDTYTIDVTNTRNENRQQVQLRWEADQVLQLSNDITVDGQRRTCVYNPPLVILHDPIRAEDFPKQRFNSTTCEQAIEISVTDRTSVKDRKGKSWQVWQVQIRREHAGRTDEEIRYFSPELGRDIRIEQSSETATSSNQTVQILSSYPAPV